MPKLKVDGVEIREIARDRRFNAAHIRLELVEALRRMMPTDARRAAMLRIRIARIGIGKPKMEAAR